MSNWITTFQEAGALWLHDGSAARPHAVLTSGLHSNGFVNCTFVTQRPDLLRRILMQSDGLKDKLSQHRVDWVIGSALGAVTFAYAVAEVLGARAGFTEKEGEAMTLKRFELEPGARVLVVEDTISTGGSTLKTLTGVAAAQPTAELLPEIVCLVNRSGKSHLDAYRLQSLIEIEIASYPPDDCPLCRIGSQAVRPKNNWAALTKV